MLYQSPLLELICTTSPSFNIPILAEVELAVCLTFSPTPPVLYTCPFWTALDALFKVVTSTYSFDTYASCPLKSILYQSSVSPFILTTSPFTKYPITVDCKLAPSLTLKLLSMFTTFPSYESFKFIMLSISKILSLVNSVAATELLANDIPPEKVAPAKIICSIFFLFIQNNLLNNYIVIIYRILSLLFYIIY